MDSGYTPTRVRYFGGEYLCTEDFQAEQNYHRRARELLNSGVFAPGIVEGLTVTVDSDVLLPQAKAFVSPGRAIDSDGQLIVLAEGASVGISDIESEKKYAIIIKYNDSSELNNSIGELSKRVVERPIVEWTALPLMEGEVLLASMSVRNGKITIDRGWGRQGMRQHAGAILGSIEFPLEIPAVLPLVSPPDPTLISIAARGYAEGDSPVLEVTAPYIALNGDVLASGGFVSVDGDLSVDNLTVNGTAKIKKELTADGGLDVTGEVTTDTLIVKGPVSGDVLTVTGASWLNGSTKITGSLTTSRAATINGLLTADQGLDVTGGATMDTVVVAGPGKGDVLEITGTSTLNGKTTIAGALTVNGTAKIAKELTADSSLTVKGVLQADGGLEVAGALTADNDFEVKGALTADKDVNVWGKLTANGGLNVAKGATTDTLTVSGTSSLGGDVTTAGGVTVTGQVTVGEKLTANCGLDVTGGGTIDSLILGQTPAVSRDLLTVYGDAKIMGSLTVGEGANNSAGGFGKWSFYFKWEFDSLSDKGSVDFPGSQFVAPKNGILSLSTSNALHYYADGKNWYSFGFCITVDNKDESDINHANNKFFATALQNGSNPPHSAAIYVPMAEGSTADFSCYMMGKTSGKIYAYISFMPLSE